MKKFTFLMVPWVLGSVSWSGAAVIASHTAATNDRFADDPAFIAGAYDWSGVGRSQTGEWATLLGDNYFLSANHFHPSVGETVTFFPGNDASSRVEYSVAGGTRIGSTDLWLGYFEEFVDASIARYGYATTSATTLAETGLGGQDVYMSGNSVTSNTAYGYGIRSDQAVGTNQVEGFVNEGDTSLSVTGLTVDLGSPAGFDWLVTYENLPGDTEMMYTTYETQLQGGDSGSPLMYVDGGSLTLAGTAYAIFTNLSANFVDTGGPPGSGGDPLEERDGTVYNYVGSYTTALEAAIAGVPAPIPEPGTFGLLGLGVVLTLLRRRG